MKQLKIFTILFFITLAFQPFFANAQNLRDAFGSRGGDVSAEQTPPLQAVAFDAGYSTGTTFDSIIGQVILTALSLLGIIFLILLIYAGYLWMTASGNDQQVSKAKGMIITAVIGLVIVLSAYSISYFVLSSLQSGALSGN